jgi:hypothetical protein
LFQSELNENCLDCRRDHNCPVQFGIMKVVLREIAQFTDECDALDEAKADEGPSFEDFMSHLLRPHGVEVWVLHNIRELFEQIDEDMQSEPATTETEPVVDEGDSHGTPRPAVSTD